jgi:DNA recombination protein RmuC
LEQSREIKEIKEKIGILEYFHTNLKEGVEKTRDVLTELKKIEEIKIERERELLEGIRRIEGIIIGTTSKGFAGEEILREIFKNFPPGMIEPNFRVKGKVVEFALVLPNKKRIPIDSKWLASDLLMKLENENDPEKKKEISNLIEKEVIKKIKEVKEYIDPAFTFPQAICAIPDSVYSVCKEAHSKAHQENVILVSYSMMVPLLLHFYQLHLEYSLPIDFENFYHNLTYLWKCLEEMENVFENKVLKAIKMLQNATEDYKKWISSMRSSLVELKKVQNENLKLPNYGVSSHSNRG